MAWRLLRDNRDFRLLYAGTLISLGGDWFLGGRLDVGAEPAGVPAWSHPGDRDGAVARGHLRNEP